MLRHYETNQIVIKPIPLEDIFLAFRIDHFILLQSGYHSSTLIDVPPKYTTNTASRRHRLQRILSISARIFLLAFGMSWKGSVVIAAKACGCRKWAVGVTGGRGVSKWA